MELCIESSCRKMHTPSHNELHWIEIIWTIVLIEKKKIKKISTGLSPDQNWNLFNSELVYLLCEVSSSSFVCAIQMNWTVCKMMIFFSLINGSQTWILQKKSTSLLFLFTSLKMLIKDKKKKKCYGSCIRASAW